MSSRSSVEEPFLHGMGHTLAVRRDSRMKNYLILILATANFIFLVTSIGLYSQVHNIRSDILQVEEVFCELNMLQWIATSADIVTWECC